MKNSTSLYCSEPLMVDKLCSPAAIRVLETTALVCPNQKRRLEIHPCESFFQSIKRGIVVKRSTILFCAMSSADDPLLVKNRGSTTVIISSQCSSILHRYHEGEFVGLSLLAADDQRIGSISTPYEILPCCRQSF